MPESPERVAIGKRMRAAALQAGTNAYEIAARLGVQPTTVYRWWWGQRSPSIAMMQAYAELVGKPVAAFYRTEGEADEAPRALSELLLGWADRLMSGERPGAAFERVTGERQHLTRPERRRVAAAGARMRSELSRAAGGDWELLTEAEQRQILDQVAQLAQRRRSERPESSR